MQLELIDHNHHQQQRHTKVHRPINWTHDFDSDEDVEVVEGKVKEELDQEGVSLQCFGDDEHQQGYRLKAHKIQRVKIWQVSDVLDFEWLINEDL